MTLSNVEVSGEKDGVAAGPKCDGGRCGWKYAELIMETTAWHHRCTRANRPVWALLLFLFFMVRWSLRETVPPAVQKVNYKDIQTLTFRLGVCRVVVRSVGMTVLSCVWDLSDGRLDRGKIVWLQFTLCCSVLKLKHKIGNKQSNQFFFWFSFWYLFHWLTVQEKMECWQQQHPNQDIIYYGRNF